MEVQKAKTKHVKSASIEGEKRKEPKESTRRRPGKSRFLAPGKRKKKKMSVTRKNPKRGGGEVSETGRSVNLI